MILIGKKISPTVSFILFDEETGKTYEVGNTEMTNLILDKKVSNAKLENTVIKMTDGDLTVVEQENAHNMFYVLGCKDGVYSLIDGYGEIWKMSFNVAQVFLAQEKKELTNAKLCSDEIVINKHRNYSTALRRSTEHYHQS